MAIHTITKSASENSLIIQSADQSQIATQAEPQLKTLSFSGSQDDAEHHSLVEELHRILKSIPTEQPPGSEDIYGKDISIAWGSEDLQWMNQAPSGCTVMASDVQPTEEDKKKFERAVEIVNSLVNKSI
jgi:hypothetical protein